MSGAGEWWRGAVIYQIYPRSFCDSNGDGIGDIPGVEGKLDYIKALGVDAVWLSPVHPSPNRDFGYDVADFNGVSDEFGGMDAFRRFVDAAHARNIRVILDEVLSHTSDQHPWFAESLRDRTNPKADWYVWADPKPDGTPPNNWLSVFGGPAWSYHPARRQYYFHKFLKQQPKLNLRNPAARKAAMDVLRFWLDFGVDGFRLDVANSFFHDAQLRDNSYVPMDKRTAHHWSHASHLQLHDRDANLPENREVLDEIRALVDGYKDRFVFGEFSEAPELIGHFAGAGHGLHSGYTFTFIDDRTFAPQLFSDHFAFLDQQAGLWPCVTFSNHDVRRTVSRWRQTGNPQFAKLALALLMSLKGTVLLYQGEELGLPDGEIGRGDVRDPVGELYYPYSKGRDPCRTPMPWQPDAPHLGFTTGKPWLPVSPTHAGLTALAQSRDERSILSFARRFIRERRAIPALVTGGQETVLADDGVFAFRRTHAHGQVLCVFNHTPAQQRRTISIPAGARALGFGPAGGTFDTGSVLLEPFGGLMLAHS
ncbi:MAG TPA: alpha-amylase family glycosyl hydrolase [Micropepsaceae bacterium]|nr:alpha-amylase family glycosyl hydrolase [Micropepsaceae bacterium]